MVKEENGELKLRGGLFRVRKGEVYLKVRRGKEERLLLSSGERCLMYSDSRMRRSKPFLAL